MLLVSCHCQRPPDLLLCQQNFALDRILSNSLESLRYITRSHTAWLGMAGYLSPVSSSLLDLLCDLRQVAALVLSSLFVIRAQTTSLGGVCAAPTTNKALSLSIHKSR